MDGKLKLRFGFVDDDPKRSGHSTIETIRSHILGHRGHFAMRMIEAACDYIVSFLLFVGVSGLSQAAGIQISGNLSYHVYETNGATVFSMEKRFTCELSGPLWRIRTWDAGYSSKDGNSPAADYDEVGTD